MKSKTITPGGGTGFEQTSPGGFPAGGGKPVPQPVLPVGAPVEPPRSGHEIPLAPVNPRGT